MQRNITPLGIRTLSYGQAEELAGYFSEVAHEHGIYIDTCAENMELDKYGIKHASCIDQDRLERIGNYKLDIERDKNQRDACNCVSSIDLGAYNTCQNGCVYCYANFNQTLVNDCCKKHNPSSPLLYGEVGIDDIIRPRAMKSLRNDQISLFP